MNPAVPVTSTRMRIPSVRRLDSRRPDAHARRRGLTASRHDLHRSCMAACYKPPLADFGSPMNRLFALAFWSAAVFAFVMAVLPGMPEAPFTVSDKILHATAFFVLAGLATLAFRRASLLTIGLYLTLF